MSEIIEQGGGEVMDTGPAAPVLTASSDLDFAPASPALVGLQDDSNSLQFGSDGFLHLLLSATDNSTGADVSLAGFSVQMTVADASRGLPASPLLLWLPATWLVPATPGGLVPGPASLPGTASPTYATLGVGPDHALLLPVGQYWLYARVTAAAGQVFVLRSATPFLVRP